MGRIKFLIFSQFPSHFNAFRDLNLSFVLIVRYAHVQNVYFIYIIVLNVFVYNVCYRGPLGRLWKYCINKVKQIN